MEMASRIVRLGVRTLFLAAFSLVAPGAMADSCAHEFGEGTSVDYGNWIKGTDYTCSKCGKVQHRLDTTCTYTDNVLHKLNADGTTSDVSETTEKPKTTPYLVWYRPAAANDNRKAFVYFPGGGYNNVDILNGGDMYGRTFAAKGYTVVVCWYRGYNPKDDSPFRDANAAMLAVRADAKAHGITEVGVAGDSAGGHLASYQHVHGTGDAKSDFAILAFPCITCGESTSYGFSGNIGATTAEKQRSYCNDLFVTAATGRAFIYVATSDAIVPCVNSYRFADALKAKGVPYALHIYKEPAFSGNDHGFKITDADKKDSLSTQIDNWLKISRRHGLSDRRVFGRRDRGPGRQGAVRSAVLARRRQDADGQERHAHVRVSSVLCGREHAADSERDGDASVLHDRAGQGIRTERFRFDAPPRKRFAGRLVLS